MTYDTLMGTLDQPAGQMAISSDSSKCAADHEQPELDQSDHENEHSDERHHELNNCDSTSNETSSCSSSVEITTKAKAILVTNTAPSSNIDQTIANLPESCTRLLSEEPGVYHHNSQHESSPDSKTLVPQVSRANEDTQICHQQSPIVAPLSTIAHPSGNGSESARTDDNKDREYVDNSAEQSPIPTDEIRARLDRLNALSDLINSLEQQSNEANRLFHRTLKQSTDRLSSIAKALGNKSIRQGRVYYASKIAVEKSQSECQRACVQFEQANKDHQFAKRAIQEAEMKLKQIASASGAGVISIADIDTTGLDHLRNLSLSDEHSCRDSSSISYEDKGSDSRPFCDTVPVPSTTTPTQPIASSPKSNSGGSVMVGQQSGENGDGNAMGLSSGLNQNAAQLSEHLNQAIVKLLETEKNRAVSQQQHFDRANKLMLEQENLIRLEREHGQSIKRSEFYFNEARQFDARLNSVKSEISRLNGDILAAKNAYAQTLSELEQFSEELHLSGRVPPPTP